MKLVTLEQKIDGIVFIELHNLFGVVILLLRTTRLITVPTLHDQKFKYIFR